MSLLAESVGSGSPSPAVAIPATEPTTATFERADEDGSASSHQDGAETDRGGRDARAWWRYLAAGAVLVVVYFANPHPAGLPGWAVRYPLYVIVNGSAVVALIVGIRRWRPDPLLPWWLMALGQALYTVGDVIYYWDRYVGHVYRFPGPADVFYLGRVPCILVALAFVVRRRSGHDRAAVIDSFIVGLAAAGVVWTFLIEPTTAGALGFSVRLTALAYPVTDLMLVVLAARLLVGTGRRGVTFYILTGGLILLAATDSLYGWDNLRGVTYGAGSLVEAGWLVYYLSVGASALHPSMRGLATPSPVDEVRRSRARLVALGAAALVGPGLLASGVRLGQHLDTVVIALDSMAVIGLVLLRLAGVMRDQEQAEAQIRHQAFHDPLTGLANRALFYDRFEHALELGRRDDRGLAVLVIDLDGFKGVNDRFGHAAGDAVLVAVARRMTAALRSTDTAARLGGDEFAVLAESLTTIKEAGAVAQRVVDALAEPLLIGGRQILARATVGVAFAASGNEAADVLLSNADAAMYTAKRELRGSYRLADPQSSAMADLPREMAERDDISAALAAAMADPAGGGLRLQYQPIVDARSGLLVGTEALIRWDRPGSGLLPPDSFIPIAETSSLIIDLDRWVLREATRQLAAWSAVPVLAHIPVAVNISGRHLLSGRLANNLRALLDETGVEPDRLSIEITETVLVTDFVAARAELDTVRALGIKVAIDDFGTGYASLADLRLLDVDAIKLDRSFISRLDEIRINAMVRAIIEVAHDAFDNEVIAEGLETEDEVTAVRDLGADSVQGYFISRPVEAADLARAVLTDAIARLPDTNGKSHVHPAAGGAGSRGGR